jgi:glycerophosphoryl diester phosphodiesterase
MKSFKFFLFFLVAFISINIFAQPKVVAHRGFWQTNGSAQNSIASLTKADSVKVFGSEFDVWMTADNQLLVNHDREYKGYKMDSTDFSILTSLKLENGENLPSLKDYLSVAKKLPDLKLFLEMKSLATSERETAAVKKIIRMVKKDKLGQRTCYIAFSKHVVKEFIRLSPHSAVYYLGGDLSPEEIKALGCAGLDYSMAVLRENQDWVERAHRLNLLVNVWTVDNSEDMDYFIGQKVDFITTNKPLLLQEKNEMRIFDK